jgi:hypothetical protein
VRPSTIMRGYGDSLLDSHCGADERGDRVARRNELKYSKRGMVGLWRTLAGPKPKAEPSVR